jgi:hypothetical protein
VNFKAITRYHIRTSAVLGTVKPNLRQLPVTTSELVLF